MTSIYINSYDTKKQPDYNVYVIVIFVIIIIYLLYKAYKKFTSPKKKVLIDLRNDFQEYYKNLHGDSFDNNAKNCIKLGEKIENKNALDHFILGSTYLINAHQPAEASRHFNNAIDIINQNPDNVDNDFILNRINDYAHMLIDHPEAEDIDIQNALIRYYTENKTNRIEENKNILEKQHWVSDSQNVHDSSISNDLKNQYIKVAKENNNIPNIATKDYESVKNWLLIRFQDEADKLHNVNEVLKFIDNNYKVYDWNIKEQDIIVCVWQRCHDPGNKDNFSLLREALANAVLDCIEGCNVVCLTGRITKVWQALATIDKDAEIGILKSKQSIKNEIYERCAKIVNDYIGDEGSVSDLLRESYIKGEDTEQVKELKEHLKQEIDKLKEVYIDDIPEDQLDKILNECKDTI